MLSGEPGVKSECLPFTQIPHTTDLFRDFLYSYEKVQSFYPRSPHFQQWIKDEAARLQYDPGRRERLAAVLRRQNQSWEASAKTLENIERLRGGAKAVVTGQQVSLFGGPAFSIYKALTAVKLASIAAEAGVECVPVFWLATEDHDLDEVKQVAIPGPDALLEKLVAPVTSKADAPVGTIAFGPEIQAVVDEAAARLGDAEILQLLRETYQPGQSFGSAFARLFAKVFAEWGVILLDASDPELHQIAAPIYAAAIERAGEINESLLERGKELEGAGFHQQVKVTSSSTLLFTLQDGARVPISRDLRDTETFVAGDQKLKQSDLLEQIHSAPQDFSPNVLLRPVVQDYLLPTVAYIGGSAEVAYFAQAAVVYEKLLGRTTPIVPRFSATLLEPKLQNLLDRYKLTMREIFAGPESLREQLAAQALPKELQSAFESAETSIKNAVAAIRAALEPLDKTLADAAENAEGKIRYQFESLRAKAARAELRQTEVVGRHAQLLSNALYPNKTLQEREIAGVYFLSRYGHEFLRNIYDCIHSDCVDHQMIFL
jgi:bacillithiol synthase